MRMAIKIYSHGVISIEWGKNFLYFSGCKTVSHPDGQTEVWMPPFHLMIEQELPDEEN